MTRTREWLLFNAVEAWLHHYSEPPTETVQQYKELRDELHGIYMETLKPKDAPTTSTPRTTRKRTNANKSAKTL